MKKPGSRNRMPKGRVIAPPPAGVMLGEIAERVHYTGSPYHKDTPSFAGPVPTPRPDASICPRALAGARDQINRWLQTAVRNGQFAADWRQNFPHIVWHREGDVIYEACLTNSGTGEYHGYPLEPDHTVRGLA